MVHRDPETGKFVSDEGAVSGGLQIEASVSENASHGYDNLVHEWLSGRYEISESNLSGGSNSASPRFEWVPGGGLGRDEVAELVAVRVGQYDAHVKYSDDGSPVTTPGSVFAESVLNRTTDARFDWDADQSFTPGSGEVSTVADVVGDRTGNHLFFISDRSQASLVDSTNGLGGGAGGGGYPHAGQVTNFRRAFGGMGPIVQRDEGVIMDNTIRTENMQNENAKIGIEIGFSWDIRSREDVGLGVSVGETQR